MTRNSILGKIKSHLIIILAVIFMFSFALFMFTACDSSKIDPPTYTKVENDESVIKNGSFEFGVSDLELDDYPITSVTGWTRATDNSATSSKVDSGVIDISEKGWNNLISTLYDDSDFFAFASNKYGINKEHVRKIVTEQNPDLKSSEIDKLVKKAIIEGYTDENGEPHLGLKNLVNPGSHDVKSTKVYMLNNYRTSSALSLGTAQKLTSSTTFDLEAGSYGKISFWVKTQNIEGVTEENKAGVNLKLVNKFNSATQSPYVLYGIVADEWTEYTVYVKADDTYACSIQTVLGLGLGNGSSDQAEDYTSGTAYFDDIVFTELTKEEFDTEIAGNPEEVAIDYSKKSTVSTFVNANTLNDKKPVYNMDLDTEIVYTALDLNNGTVDGALTKSSVTGTAKDILGEANVDEGTIAIDKTNGKISLTNIKNLAYTFTVKNNAFKLAGESYALISFKIKNNLGAFDVNGVSVYVNDENGSSVINTSAVTSKTSKEDTVYTVLVKNNFPELDKENKFINERQFSLSIYVGPTKLSSDLKAKDFATGTVEITEFKIATGKTYQFVRDAYVLDSNNNVTAYNVTDVETANYSIYNLLASGVTSTVSLYAGESANYTNPSADAYSMSVSPNEFGTIVSAPSIVAGYTGIVADHSYIENTETSTSIVNTRSGYIDGRNHAGLINTKYLDNYASIDGLANIKSAIGNYSSDIQPIMIYNDTLDAYGFISSSISMSASAHKKISVDVKVVGDAKAYIYLVATDSADKDVLTIDVLSNTDGIDYTTPTEITTHDLKLEITSDMMDKTGEKQGWLTVTFYVATGSTAKDFRLEMWNGGRDGSDETKSQGYVFFNNVNTGESFTEPSYVNAFASTDSILYSLNQKDISLSQNAVAYKRVLDAKEIAYNKTQSAEDKISYDAKYIWAKNYSTIYAIFNSVDPVPVDPNTTTDDTDDGDPGCTGDTDPATFWLSFSSIILAVVLVLAIVMLFIKNFRARRKANKNDAKSYYKVSSRYKEDKPVEKVKKQKKFIEQEEIDKALEEYTQTVDNTAEPVEEIPAEEVVENESTNENSLDEYVYGDVQTFDADSMETNEDKND